MGTNKDLVSIIITTCRGDKRLRRAVDSVLSQTYFNIEIIIVDDNGKNTEAQKNTYNIIKDYIIENKVKYVIHETNRNGAVARNTGFNNSQGQYIGFLDDDDMYLPSRIEKLVKAMREKKSDAAYSSVIFIDEEAIIGERRAKRNGFTQGEFLINQSLLGTGSNVFVTRKAFDSVKGFDESFQRYQDVEFMIRVLDKHQIVGIDDYLVVKDNTAARFYPNFEHFRRTQQKFIDKFKNLIFALKPEEKRACLISKKKELLFSGYASMKSKNITMGWEDLNKWITDLSMKEKILIRIKGIYIKLVSNHLKPFKLIKKEIRMWCLRRKIPQDVLYEVNRMISNQ